MATATFASISNEVTAVIPMCPPQEVLAALRNAAIEFCKNTQQWCVDLTPISIVAGTSTYTLVPPSNTQLVTTLVLKVSDVIVIDNRALDFRRSFPTHPDTTNPGTVTDATLEAVDTVNLYPVPSANITNGIEAYCAVAPSITATGMDATVLQTNHETLARGALYRLFLQPKAEWYDAKMGDFYARKWKSEIVAAKAARELGYTRRSISVASRRIV